MPNESEKAQKNQSILAQTRGLVQEQKAIVKVSPPKVMKLTSQARANTA